MKIVSILLLFVLVGCASSEKNQTKSDSTTKAIVESGVGTGKASVTGSDSDLKKAWDSGNLESVKRIATDKLQNNKNDLDGLNSLALYYYQKGQLEAANVLLNKATKVAPNAEAIYNNLGLVALAKNENKLAVDAFKKSISLKTSTSAVENLLSVYVQQKDYQSAAELFDSSNVDQDQLSAASVYNFALSQQAVNKVDQSAEHFKLALKKQPDNKQYMLAYASLLIEKQQKYQEGLDLIDRLKFVGYENESTQLINELENKAKAGLK